MLPNAPSPRVSTHWAFTGPPCALCTLDLPRCSLVGRLEGTVRAWETRGSAAFWGNSGGLVVIESSAQFLEVLRQSGLLESKDFAVAEAAARRFSDASALARYLVQKKLLTRWQAGQLLLGRTSFTLGKYQLLDLLGRGGMGKVFLARHTMMNRTVALKLIAEQWCKESAALERFLNEARAAAALDHPNLVHAYNVDTEGDRYYMVLEYVEGEDLQRRVESGGPLPFDLAADYIRQAADGLAHAHAKGMIHCDIKPSNLLVNTQGMVKILDLGVSRWLGQAGLPAGSDSDKGPGTEIVGSVDYMAPEQVTQSQSVDHRADIYSLGCTLFFLLTGRPPFGQGTLSERIAQHQSGQIPDVRQLRPDTPAELAEICQRMMAKDPQDRIQSAAEVAEELALWLGNRVMADGSAEEAAATHASAGAESGATESEASAQADVQSLRWWQDRRRLGIVAGVAALAVVLLAIMGFLATRRGEKQVAEAERPKAAGRAKRAEDDLWKGLKLAVEQAPADSQPASGPATASLASSAGSSGNAAKADQGPKKSSAQKESSGGSSAAVSHKPAPAQAARPMPTEPSAAAKKPPAPGVPPPAAKPAPSPGAKETVAQASTSETSKPDAANKEAAKPEPGKQDSGKSHAKEQSKPHTKTEPAKQPPKELSAEGEEPATQPGRPIPSPAKPGGESDMAEAASKAAAKDPLQDITGPLELPPLEEGVSPRPVRLARFYGPEDLIWTAGLVGGDVALRGTRKFTMAQRQSEGRSDWGVFLTTTRGKEETETEVARFYREKEALMFRWADGADPLANHLRNCLLELRAGGAPRAVPLRAPQKVDPLPIDFVRGANESIELHWPPANDALRIEVTGIEGAGGKRFPLFVCEPRTPAGLKPPIVVSLLRKDLYNQENPVFRFQLTPQLRAKALALDFRLRKDNPPLPRNFNAEQARLLLVNPLRELEILMKDEKKKRDPKLRMQKDALDLQAWIADTYLSLHKTGRLHFRVFADLGGPTLELAYTELPKKK